MALQKEVDALDDTDSDRVSIEYDMVVVPSVVHLHKLLDELVGRREDPNSFVEDMPSKNNERNDIVWPESINGREEAVL